MEKSKKPTKPAKKSANQKSSTKPVAKKTAPKKGKNAEEKKQLEDAISIINVEATPEVVIPSEKLMTDSYMDASATLAQLSETVITETPSLPIAVEPKKVSIWEWFKNLFN